MWLFGEQDKKERNEAIVLRTRLVWTVGARDCGLLEGNLVVRKSEMKPGKPTGLMVDGGNAHLSVSVRR